MKYEENIEFVHGCGKRKTILQRSIEKLEEYLDKLKQYTQKIHICGKRNSYSKPDNDATSMRMKEDAMKNGQLKAGYNVQHGVDSEYIVWVTVGSEAADPTTLILFLKRMEEFLEFKYEKIVTDSGYESEDYYTCKNNKKLIVSKTIKRKSTTGYESEKTIYISEDCSNCLYKSKCIKGNNCKTLLEKRIKNLETSILKGLLKCSSVALIQLNTLDNFKGSYWIFIYSNNSLIFWLAWTQKEKFTIK